MLPALLWVVRVAEKGGDEPFVLAALGEGRCAFGMANSVGKEQLRGLEGLVEVPPVALRYVYKVLPLLCSRKPDQELRGHHEDGQLQGKCEERVGRRVFGNRQVFYPLERQVVDLLTAVMVAQQCMLEGGAAPGEVGCEPLPKLCLLFLRGNVRILVPPFDCNRVGPA